MTKQLSIADLFAVVTIAAIVCGVVRFGLLLSPEVHTVDGTILAAGLLVAGVSAVAFVGIVQGR